MTSLSWSGAPVAVLGAGPVGQTTALLLARWGVPVVLLDQRPHRDPIGSKSICQQRDVLDIWEAVGAGDRIAAEGVTWTTARTFYGDQEIFSYEFAEPGKPAFPPFVNISQTRTEQILDERIAAEPLVDVRWGHDVVGIVQDAEGVTVHSRSAGGPVELRASYAVACTGARSEEIRDLLGVRFEGLSFDDRFLICDIRVDLGDWAHERRFFFDPEWNPGRQVLIHPCPDSTFRIDWQVPGDYDLDAEVTSGALDTRIRKIIGERDYDIVWKSVYRFQARSVDRMRVGRVLIAGDAAHVVSPFGARGLNTGVFDAENAAWKIAYAGYGWADDAADALLESYHTERHAATAENLAITTATMGFLVPAGAEQVRARKEILTAALRDPVVAAQVDAGRFSEPFWYVDSPLTTPTPARPFAGRPPRGQVPPPGPGILIPDAPVRTPEGTISRVRRLARDGLLLLTGDEIDDAAVMTATERVHGPVLHLALSEIDPEGVLTATLDARPDELWIVRPDAYVAAVLTRPAGDQISAALDRAVARANATPPSTAHTITRKEKHDGALSASR